jgi:hypothetical protein
VDDLGVVDPAQVRRGDPEICMAELSLDDEQRNALARHLDSVSVPELVRRKPATNAGGLGHATQLATDHSRGTGPAAGGAAQDAEQRADGQSRAQLQPGIELLPCPAIHSHLAPTAALAGANQDGAALAVKVGLGSASASLIRNPARHSTMITPRSLIPSGPSPAPRMTAMISSTVGGSGGYRRPLFGGVRPW